MHPLRKSALSLGPLALGLALLVPAAASAQVREVVSKEVSVGRSEAALRLEFADEGRLEISLENGSVVVNGEVVGSFEPGGEVEAAWRDLLSQAVALDDGPLSRMLSDWTVPADLAGELADVAREIDRALEEALTDVQVDIDAEAGSVSVSVGDQRRLVQLLFGSLERLGALDEALDGLGSDVRVHIDEDVDVDAGDVVEGSMVVIEGRLRIEGEVEGDVVVVGGSVDVREGARVHGQIRLADARVIRNQGAVDGGVVDVLEEERDFETALRDEIRREIREEVRNDLRNEIRNVTRGEDSFSLMAPFRPIVRGVGGVAEKLLAILLLGLIGAGVLAFAGPNLDVISESARRSPGRAAMVGVAGTFLLVPVWILGAIALAVSIIGIPVMIAWLPLFPLAAVAAAVVGYLAVARNAGEWLADSEYPWTGWIRKSNSWMTMVGGLVGLMLAFIAANVLSMAPFLGFFSGLLAFAGAAITFVAIQIGFGAVILTRAGRRPEYTPQFDPDAAWEAAMSVDVDAEGPGTGTAGDTAEGERDDA
jgi:hypothetical protein